MIGKIFLSALAVLLAVVLVTCDSNAQETPEPERPAKPNETDLAKKSQNPVSDLVSVPFQQNFNWGAGETGDKMSYVLNVQPVVPTPAGDDWNVVTRAILPIVDQPVPAGDRTFGLGDLLVSFFMTPQRQESLTWGLGPAVQLPTATSAAIGSEKWALGPTGVLLATVDQWVLGALGSQLWSFAGASNTREVNAFLLQPIANYNLSRGWAIISAPIITADWARPSDRWTVPLGAGVSKTAEIAEQPVQLSTALYWNVVRPADGPDGQVRVTLAFLFPR